LTFLTFISFIAIIAALVQFVEMAMEKFSPSLYNSLGIFLPLIAVNCAILGACLFNETKNHNFGQSIVFGLSGGIGWWLAIIIFAAIREKMKYSHVPKGMRGLALSFLICGLIAMVFQGFSGIKLKTKIEENESMAKETAAVEQPVETQVKEAK